MNEPTKTDFQPHWYRNATPEMKDALAEFPSTGSIPLDWPRIVTRVLPSSGLSSLSAHTVADVIDLTQKLAHYAAFHEIRGPNPDFADMRSMGADVLWLAYIFSKLKYSIRSSTMNGLAMNPNENATRMTQGQLPKSLRKVSSKGCG